MLGKLRSTEKDARVVELVRCTCYGLGWRFVKVALVGVLHGGDCSVFDFQNRARTGCGGFMWEQGKICGLRGRPVDDGYRSVDELG